MTFVDPSLTAAGDSTKGAGANQDSGTVANYEELLQGLVQANRRLLATPHWQLAATEVLAVLGEVATADRACIYKHHPHPETGEIALSLRFEWLGEGVATSLPHWQNLAYTAAGLERWLSCFSAGEILHGRTATLPFPEQAVMARDRILSLIRVPIFVGGEVWGLIGFDRCHCDGPFGPVSKHRSWNEGEQAIVQAVADSLGSAIARQQALEQLRTSELRLKKLSANVPGMLYQFKLAPDGSSSFLYVSDACRTILGLEPEAMDQALNYVHPQDRISLERAIQESARTFEPFAHEWRIRTPAGQEKWVQGNARPEVQGNGAIVWDGVLLDVTLRKRAEGDIQESYGLLNSVINGTSDLIFVKDPEGRYLLANDALQRTLASEDASLVGQTDDALYPQDVAATIQATDQQVMALGQPQTFEQTVPLGSELRTFLVTKTPYYNAAGESQGIIGISRDVTDLQQARAERDRFFQLSRDLIGILGFDGYLKRINPAFTAVLGYSEAELLALPLLEFIHPDDLAATLAIGDSVLAGQSLHSFENRWRCKDGTYRWLSWSSVTYAEDQILYATARDITERKQTEARLQASERRFRDVTEAAGEYVWEIDVNGVYTFLTDKVEMVKGHSASALMGRSSFEVMLAEDIPRLQSVLQSAAIDKHSFTLAYRNINPRGEVVWEEVSGLPMLDGAGTVIGFRGTGLSITDKKRVEATLRLFRQALDSSGDAICITDTDSVQTYQNQAFCDLFEFASITEFQEQVGNIANVYADPRMADYIFQVIRKQGAYTGEVMMRSQRGRLIPALLQANAIQDDDGNIVGTIRSYTDISDRKAAEARLQIQEQFLRSIYDGVEDSIFVFNVQADGDIVYTSHNRAAEKATGKSSDSIAGKTPEAVFGPEAGQEIRDRCRRCIEIGTAITQEEYLPLQGKFVWRLSTFNPLRDLSGNIHRIVGTSIDITGLKIAQAALKQQAQLSAFRAEIDSILTRGGDLGAMLQRCSQVIVKQMEATLARIWTLNVPEQVLELQASAGLYTNIDGTHARIPVGQLKIGQIAAERQPQFTNDMPHDARIGDPGWVQREAMIAFVGYPLIVDDELLGVVALFARHPLADSALDTLGLVADELALGIRRKQTEEQLQASETKLRLRARELKATLQDLRKAQAQLVQSEKMSSLGQLVAGVAHEINNPVNFIYGNLTHARVYAQDLLGLVNLYQTHYPQPEAVIQAEVAAIDLPFVMEDLPKLLNSMKVGAERIQEIVSSLRIFSRMDEAEMKAVDIHQGIDSTLMILQNRIKARPDGGEVAIHRDYGPLPLVECYAGQLNQVFMNILSNALDALEEQRSGSTPKPPAIYIQTQLTPDQQVEIRFRDNGPGVPAAVRDRLFDPFFTTKPIGEGTGMGLSISYQVVAEKHGGTLTCDSEVGVGTTFIITIPLQQE
ncbi:PAS domain S-box protein [Leptolyngbya sp. PCC 6406]|uniref:PAS domain S-box protein n=1 Tax=Leptolyngbya sp. PCC 6406 TaxID=1173264 RepID=UPI0002AC74A7|nr:PAS domain S-box protein [Leptolyngbya sp. PCC 6406]